MVCAGLVVIAHPTTWRGPFATDMNHIQEGVIVCGVGSMFGDQE